MCDLPDSSTRYTPVGIRSCRASIASSSAPSAGAEATTSTAEMPSVVILAPPIISSRLFLRSAPNPRCQFMTFCSNSRSVGVSEPGSSSVYATSGILPLNFKMYTPADFGADEQAEIPLSLAMMLRLEVRHRRHTAPGRDPNCFIVGGVRCERGSFDDDRHRSNPEL